MNPVHVPFPPSHTGSHLAFTDPLCLPFPRFPFLQGSNSSPSDPFPLPLDQLLLRSAAAAREAIPLGPSSSACLPPSRLHLRNLNLHQGSARGKGLLPSRSCSCLLDVWRPVPAFSWRLSSLVLSCLDDTIRVLEFVFVNLLWYLSDKTQNASETMRVSCFCLRSCWCGYIFRCD